MYLVHAGVFTMAQDVGEKTPCDDICPHVMYDLWELTYCWRSFHTGALALTHPTLRRMMPPPPWLLFRLAGFTHGDMSAWCCWLLVMVLVTMLVKNCARER